MPTFSVTDAAFAGFRLTRERFVAVLSWAVLYFAMALVMGVMFTLLAPGALEQMQAAQEAGTPPDPAASLALVQRAAPAFLLALIIGVVYFGVQRAAALRAFLRPTEHAPTNLALGGDEVRQIGLAFIFALLFFAVIFLAALVIGVVAGVIGANNAGAGALVAVLLGLAAFVGFVFVAVRLSLASAQTFVEERLNLFGSWRLTKGRFWPLFGAYLLTGILMVVVGLLAFVIMGAVYGVMAVGSGEGLSSIQGMMRQDTTSLATFLTATTLIGLAFESIMQGLFVALGTGPVATAYRAFGDGAAMVGRRPEYDASV